MTKLITLLLMVSFFGSCQSQKKETIKKEYPRRVGDLKKNNSDNPNFELCNGEKNVFQYFNNSKGFEYSGGKTQVLKGFETNFIPTEIENQTGIIRIRFIVNCKGKTGKFRVMEANNDYKEFKFNSTITDQLLTITKSLNG